MSVGCHRLVRDGALLVTRSDEVLEAVAPIGSCLAGPPDAARGRPTDGLDTPAALVHDALPARGARDTRWLALESGMPIGAVRIALVALERRGLVEHCEGRWRRRVVQVDEDVR
jgi:DNA processing protein